MTFNIGIIGPGGIVERKLAPALAQVDGAALWSVLSRDRSRAAAFAERYAAASPEPAHDDLDTMLADPHLHGVIIATPDKMHAEQTIAAAAHGKHVLVEKPMCTDLESGQRMVTACRDAGVTLAVGYHLRHHAGLKQVHAMAEAGQFGRLEHVRAQWTFKVADAANWRASSDVGRFWGLGGVGTHSLDQVMWFLGGEGGDVVEVSSIISRARFGGPHDETAVIALRFDNGATAEISSSVLIDAPSRLEIYGSDGYVTGDGVLSVEGDGALRIGSESFDYDPVNPYAAEIKDFMDAATSGRPPAVSGDEGLRNVAVLLEAAPLAHG